MNNKFSTIVLSSIFLLVCSFLFPSISCAEDILKIGRMKVTIMPEYDSQSVLVVQEGKFADRTMFPKHVTFSIPQGVDKLTDACSLSPGGQHFCQLYDIAKGDARNFVKIGLPYSDFFIDYKYSPFPIKENSKREFTFSVFTYYDIETLEVDIQRPYRVKDFTITPSSEETYTKKDFEYTKYTFNDVKAEEEKVFNISYFKEDTRPSVDIKYESMSTQGFFDENIGELLLGAGILALAALFYLRRKKN